MRGIMRGVVRVALTESAQDKEEANPVSRRETQGWLVFSGQKKVAFFGIMVASSCVECTAVCLHAWWLR